MMLRVTCLLLGERRVVCRGMSGRRAFSMEVLLFTVKKDVVRGM